MSVYYYLIHACLGLMFTALLTGIFFLLLIPRDAAKNCKQRNIYSNVEPAVIIVTLICLLSVIILQHKYVQSDCFAGEQARLELRRAPSARERIDQAKQEMLKDTTWSLNTPETNDCLQ